MNKFKNVEKLLLSCFFKDELKLELIKIAPMDEKELVLKKNSCSHKQKKEKGVDRII